MFVKNSQVAKDAWEALQRTVVTNRGIPKTPRGSGLPFCPRAFYLDRIFGPVSTTSSFQNEVTTERGKAVHSCIQKWLGEASLLFGFWSCPLKEFKICDYVEGPRLGSQKKKCPTHSLPLIYEEFELEYKGMSGHPDGLITFNKNPPYTLTEFKTAASNPYSDFPGFLNLTEPYWKHVDQANSYANIINKKGVKIKESFVKYPVDKIIIWYIHSDYLHRDPKIWEFKPDEKRFKKVVKSLKKVKKAKKENVLPDRTCEKRNDWCDYSPICWSNKIDCLIMEKFDGK